jgi:hypothetical protein
MLFRAALLLAVLVCSKGALAWTVTRAGRVAAASFAAGLQIWQQVPLPVHAATSSFVVAGSLENANNKLAEYNLTPVLFVPPGFQTIVSEFGRGSAKTPMSNPIVVQFSAPGLWVTKKTNVNTNGEAGTISAGDYIKGDSAFLFTSPGPLPTDKSSISSFIQKSLSQKGDPLESFKLTNIKSGIKGEDGREYTLADIAYSLNTEAGFLIGRKGVVSITSVGSQVQALVSVTTDKRWKNLETTIRDIAGTFRVYKLNTGIFSGQE